MAVRHRYNENFVNWILSVEEKKREALIKEVLVNQCGELGYTQELAERSLYQLTSAIQNVNLLRLTTDMIEKYKRPSRPRKRSRSTNSLEKPTEHKKTTTVSVAVQVENDTTTFHESKKLAQNATTTFHESKKLAQNATTTFHESKKLDQNATTTFHESEKLAQNATTTFHESKKLAQNASTTFHKSKKVTDNKSTQVTKCAKKSKNNKPGLKFGMKCPSPTPSEMDRQWENTGLIPPRKQASSMWKVPVLPCIDLFLDSAKSLSEQQQQTMSETKNKSVTQSSNVSMESIDQWLYNSQSPTLGFSNALVNFTKVKNTKEPMSTVSSLIAHKSSDTAQPIIDLVPPVKVKEEPLSQLTDEEHRIKVEEVDSINPDVIIKTESEDDSFAACSRRGGNEQSIKIPVNQTGSKKISESTYPFRRYDEKSSVNDDETVIPLLTLLPSVKKEF